jgi:hypothetical protein
MIELQEYCLWSLVSVRLSLANERHSSIIRCFLTEEISPPSGRVENNTKGYKSRMLVTRARPSYLLWLNKLCNTFFVLSK